MPHVDVLYTFDESYAPYAGVSLFSLLSHNSSPSLRVFAITQGVSDQSKQRLQAIADRFGHTVTFLQGDALASELNSLQLCPYRQSAAANFRLFFERLLPPDTERVLYLDCDTLVCDSLAPLQQLDLGGKAIGAVRDALTVRYKRLLGFAAEQPYYNSGVLLLDTRRWREMELTDRLVAFLKQPHAPLLFPDQDLLNLALGDEIAALPVQYNLQPHHRVFCDKTYFAVYPQADYYTADELQAARSCPCILHAYRFIGEFPWHGGKLHPDAKAWESARSQTPWKGEKPPKPHRSLVMKAEALLYRILPKRAFLRLFSVVTLRRQKKQFSTLQKEKKK